MRLRPSVLSARRASAFRARLESIGLRPDAVVEVHRSCGLSFAVRWTERGEPQCRRCQFGLAGAVWYHGAGKSSSILRLDKPVSHHLR